MARRATAAKKPVTALVELISLYRKKRAIGAKFYGQADELLQAIAKRLRPGRRVPLVGGVFAVLTDPFEAGGGKAFKPVYLSRYELQIVDADGRETRLRDRNRAKPAAKGKRRFY